MILFRDEVKVKGRNSARESELPEPECSRVPGQYPGFPSAGPGEAGAGC